MMAAGGRRRDPAVWCRHGSTVVADGHETVCRDCGTVVDARRVEEAPPGAGQSYHMYGRHSLGSADPVPAMRLGEGRDSCELRRYMPHRMEGRAARTVSRIAGVCDALRLPGSLQEDVLHRYRRIRAGGRACGMTPECVALAVYRAAMDRAVAVSDRQITEAVKLAFGRRKMPSLARIAYRLGGAAGAGGGARGDRYSFNLMLHRVLRGTTWGRIEYERNSKRAWDLYLEVYTAGGRKARLRQAIAAAFGVGGRP